jgi:hypothetical protein
MQRARRAAHLALGLLAGVVLAVVAASGTASAAPSSVTPIVVCSVTHNGTTHTVFGYDNSGPALTLGVGASNQFSPGPADRGQPTTFQPGTKINVFSVDAPGPVTWTVDGAAVHTPGLTCQTTPASSNAANWGPVAAIVGVTLVLGMLLFWRTLRVRIRS